MKGMLLAAAAIGAAVLAAPPIGAMLAPRIVGGVVPTSIGSLAGYLALKSDGSTPSPLPLSVSDPSQVPKLKELSALALGGGAAVGALVYVVLGRML